MNQTKNACITAVLLAVTISLAAQGFQEDAIKATYLETSNLPIIILETGGQEIPDADKININMGIINNSEGENNINDPFNDYDGLIGIETRGSSSSGWPKRSYSLETRNPARTRAAKNTPAANIRFRELNIFI